MEDVVRQSFYLDVVIGFYIENQVVVDLFGFDLVEVVVYFVFLVLVQICSDLVRFCVNDILFLFQF